jgi:phage gp29-like protein
MGRLQKAIDWARRFTDPPAPKKPDTTEIAATWKDVTLFGGYKGWARDNPDKTLTDASLGGLGIRAYEDIEKDAQVYAMLQQRRMAVIGCEWEVLPASDKRQDKKIADFVQEVMKKANIDTLTSDLMQGLLTGYKLDEVMWGASEGDVWISEFRGRAPHRFTFDWDDRPRLLTTANMIQGEALPERKFQSFSFGSADYNPFGNGLGRILWWWVWFKKNSVKFWLIFQEKFGSPTVVGKYPPGSCKEDRDKLLEVIESIQQETGITIPETMALELLQAGGTGRTQGSYGEFCDYCDRAIAKVLVGQTLSSDVGTGGGGSYALGQTHGDVRREIVKADADMLCAAINNQAVRWLVDFNFGPQQTYPTIWRRTEPEQDLAALAQRDKIILIDMGMGPFVPKSYISETYGIPLAKDGEETIGQPPVTSGSPEVQFAEVSTSGQSAVDRMGDQAIGAASEEMDTLLGPVMKLINNAASLEEIGERLFKLYPTMDADKFQEMLARALFLAQLHGVASVVDEAK